MRTDRVRFPETVWRQANREKTMKCRAGIYVSLLNLAACILMMTGVAAAQGRIQLGDLNVKEREGIRLGRLTVAPSIGYEMEYHSNVFRAPFDRWEEDDLIHTFTPAVHLTYDLGYSQFLDAGVKGKVAVYSNYSENNYESVSPYISYEYKRSTGFYMSAGDKFTYSTDPYNTEDLYREGEQVESWENDFLLLLGYRLGNKWFAEATYDNHLERYDKNVDKWRDEIDHVYSLAVFYQLTGKTAVFGQFRQKWAEYDAQNDGHGVWSAGTSRDYLRTSAFAGLRFEEGGKLSGQVKLGYSLKDFDNDRDPYGREYINDESWAAEAEVDYQFRPRTRLTALLNRSIEGAPDVDSASYVNTSVGLKVAQRFGDRIYSGLGFSWGRYDYSEEAPGRPRKRFDIYRTRADVQYRIMRWLYAGAKYEFISKQAGNDRYQLEEYDDHVITLLLTATL